MALKADPVYGLVVVTVVTSALHPYAAPEPEWITLPRSGMAAVGLETGPRRSEAGTIGSANATHCITI